MQDHSVALSNISFSSKEDSCDRVGRGVSSALRWGYENPLPSVLGVICVFAVIRKCLPYVQQIKNNYVQKKVEPKSSEKDLFKNIDKELIPKDVLNFCKRCDPAVKAQFEHRSGTKGGNSLRFVMYGPSGSGKTQAAMYLIYTLRKPFKIVTTDSILSKYVNQSSINFQSLLCDAAVKAKEHDGYILFFDEADVIFPQRKEDGTGTEDGKVVDTFLQMVESGSSVEGMDKVTMILATNNLANIDKAVLSRCTAGKIEVPLPDLDQRKRMWTVLFERANDIDDDAKKPETINTYVSRTTNLSLRDIQSIFNGAIYTSIEEKSATVMRKHFDGAIRRKCAQSHS